MNRHLFELLDQCTNALTGPLTEQSRLAIIAFVADPRASTWEDAAGVVLNYRSMTLFQCWRAVDESAPKRGRVYEATANGYVVAQDWLSWPGQTELQMALVWAAEVALWPHKK